MCHIYHCQSSSWPEYVRPGGEAEESCIPGTATLDREYARSLSPWKGKWSFSCYKMSYSGLFSLPIVLTTGGRHEWGNNVSFGCKGDCTQNTEWGYSLTLAKVKPPMLNTRYDRAVRGTSFCRLNVDMFSMVCNRQKDVNPFKTGKI